MMFKIGINNKNLTKYSPKKSNLQFENWNDFVRKCKIRTGGKIDYFNPYNYQLKLIDLMVGGNVIICKSRQLGISELICSYFLFNAICNPGYLGLIVSKSQRDSSLLARRIKRMIEGFDGEIKTKTDNIGDVEIDGGGRILFGNSNPEFYRGIESISHVFIDEFAFIPDVINIRNAIKPAQLMLGENAREFIVSTPNGKNNEFFRLLNSGNNDVDLMSEIEKTIQNGEFKFWLDDDNWCKFLVSWKSHPKYSKIPNFLENIKKNQKLTDDIINQEYNLSFQDSQSSIFNIEDIRKNSSGKIEDEIDENNLYFFGVDTSTSGNDYTVCIVLKFIHHENRLSLVNIYRKKKETSEYHIFKISELIDKFQPSMIGIEVNGCGQIYFEQLSKSNTGFKFKKIVTTKDSKLMMISRLKLFLESSRIEFPKNNMIIEEFLNFRRVGEKLEAISGKNDDIIMAISFALEAFENWEKI